MTYYVPADWIRQVYFCPNLRLPAAVVSIVVQQIGYNTNCCGLAVQLRTIGEGVGRRTEMRLSFAVANIGSFGNLRRQERLF